MKKVFLTKSGEPSMKTIIQKLEDFDFQDEAKVDTNIASIRKEHSLPESFHDTAKLVTALIEISKDEIPAGVTFAISKDAGLSVVKKADEDARVEKALADANELHKKEIDDIVKTTEERIAKAETFVSEENKENFKKVMKGESPRFVEISKEAQAQIDKQSAEIAELKKEISDRKDRELFASLVLKAKEEFPRLGKAEDVALVLKSVKASASDDVYSKIESILKFAQGQISGAGEINKELGSDHDGKVDKEVIVQKKAEELKKADPSLTIEKARVMVREQNPELY